MLGSLFRSISGRGSSAARSDFDVDDDIPRYPPFAKGLPSASTSKILETQKELISRIQSALRFDRDTFNNLVLPVIERYAAYVHLLPASEGHHHRGAGGLFRHGLEVGFWAAQRAEQAQFCVGDTPRQRRENEPRWQLAAFLGGLLHDVGKPLSDVAVTDKHGHNEWNPYEASLYEWTKNARVDHYFLRWHTKRNKRHEKFSMMNLDQIITSDAKSFLNKPGPKIMECLLESLVGTGASETLTKLVLWADQESVSRDVKNQRIEVDEHSYGVPVERFIFDALRRLATTKKVNEPGAMIWKSKDGLFLSWNPIVTEIHRLTDKDGVPGIPRQKDTLADILIEKGFATRYPGDKHKKPSLYWEIYPELLKGVKLSCLRLDDVDLVFTNEPPSDATIWFEPQEDDQETQNVNDKVESNSSGNNQASSRIQNDGDTSHGITQATNEQHNNGLIPPKGEDGVPKKPLKDVADNNTNLKDYSEIDPPPPTDELVPSQVIDFSDGSAECFVNTDTGEILSVNQDIDVAVYAEENREILRQDDNQQDENSTEHPSLGGTPGWDIVSKVVTQIKARKIHPIETNNSYAIKHQDDTRKLGDPREVMAILSGEQLLMVDQFSGSKTTVIDEIRCLVLTEDVTKKIKDVIESEKTQVPVKGKSEKKKDRKVVPMENFEKEFIKQAALGFGSYISGKVEKEEDVDWTVYKVPYESISKISEKLGKTETTVLARLTGTEGISVNSSNSKATNGYKADVIQVIVKG